MLSPVSTWIGRPSKGLAPWYLSMPRRPSQLGHPPCVGAMSLCNNQGSNGASGVAVGRVTGTAYCMLAQSWTWVLFFFRCNPIQSNHGWIQSMCNSVLA